MQLTLIATTIMGLESTVSYELKRLGYTPRVFDTRVEFSGTLIDICRANLWLRTAGRVYVKLAEFTAETFDDLFDQTADVPWENWIGEQDQFPVTKVMSKKSTLFSRSDCQAIIKKAIAKRLQSAYQIRTLPETGALMPIRVSIVKNIVTISLDTTGPGLNKRGYRAPQTEAPLRETLAAGLLYLSRWRPDTDVLMDPFCGTGTILIEAAMIAQNKAPGLLRSFISEQWSLLSSDLWASARTECMDHIDPQASYTIMGSDHHSPSLRTARENSLRANMTGIHVQNRPFNAISSRFKTGLIITNPPYGHRLGQSDDVYDLYQSMGRLLLDRFPQWSYAILCGNESFKTAFGIEPSGHRKLYNGGIKCYFYQYHRSKRSAT